MMIFQIVDSGPPLMDWVDTEVETKEYGIKSFVAGSRHVFDEGVPFAYSLWLVSPEGRPHRWLAKADAEIGMPERAFYTKEEADAYCGAWDIALGVGS